jgi:hypothetical protein
MFGPPLSPLPPFPLPHSGKYIRDRTSELKLLLLLLLLLKEKGEQHPHQSRMTGSHCMMLAMQRQMRGEMAKLHLQQRGWELLSMENREELFL